MILKMKSLMKNIIVAICATTVLIASATAFAAPTTKGSVSATSVNAPSSSSTSTRSYDDEEETTEDTDYTNEDEESTGEEESTTTAGAAASGITQDTSRVVPTAVPVSSGEEQNNIVQNSEAQKLTNKKYASKGALAFWVIFLILINAVVSFLIGNRFYKLAKKESHVTSEIRALRRDLEEKFVNNVGGFNEMETDVTNTNDNFSMDGSINMPDRKSVDYATESEDVFKKWEDRKAQRRSAIKEEPVIEEPEKENEYEEEEKPKKKFRPLRERKVEAEDNDEDDDSIDDEKGIDAVKNKAKSFLNDIFPFKED